MVAMLNFEFIGWMDHRSGLHCIRCCYDSSIVYKFHCISYGPHGRLASCEVEQRTDNEATWRNREVSNEMS
jgi:hypothetical protein